MVVRKSNDEGVVFGKVVCSVLGMAWFGWWYGMPMAEDVSYANINVLQIVGIAGFN